MKEGRVREDGVKEKEKKGEESERRREGEVKERGKQKSVLFPSYVMRRYNQSVGAITLAPPCFESCTRLSSINLTKLLLSSQLEQDQCEEVTPGGHM